MYLGQKHVGVGVFYVYFINQEIYMFSKQFTESSCIQQREKSPFINIQSCLKGIAIDNGIVQKNETEEEKLLLRALVRYTRKKACTSQWHLLFSISIQL